MTMAFFEGELRATGDLRDAGYADVIAGILHSRGEDIPLPQLGEEPRQEPLTTLPGRLALSSSVVEVPQNVDAIDAEYTHRTEISTQAKAIAQPFVDAIGADLVRAPEPSRIDVWRERCRFKQYVTNTIGPRDIMYSLTTPYEQRAGLKVATGFQVDLSTKAYSTSARNPADVRITLAFKNNTLDSVLLDTSGEGKLLQLLGKYSNIDDLQFLAKLYTRGECRRLKVDLDFKRLGVYLTDAVEHEEYSRTQSSFVYVPGSASFEEKFKKGWNAPDEVRSLSTERFLNLTQSILNLIPTVAAPVEV